MIVLDVRSCGSRSRRVAAGKPVVFDFTDLVHRGFRYGLINTTVLAMGEFGAFFVLPIFLQAGLHLSAIRSGTWLLPAGIMAFVGGGIGGQLSRRFGPKYVITVGLDAGGDRHLALRRRVLARRRRSGRCSRR